MRNIIFSISFIFLFFSCRKVEKIEKIGNITPKLVVNCVAKTGLHFQFDVSKSLSALDNAPQRILKNATIFLYENGVLAETIEYNSLIGKYLTDTMYAKAGHKYSFTATSPGLADVSAEMIAVAKVPIDDAKLTVEGLEKTFNNLNNLYNYYFNSAKISLKFKDNKDEKNYYFLTVYKKWAGGNVTFAAAGGYNWETKFPGVESVQNGVGTRPNFFIHDDFSNGSEMKIELSLNGQRIYAGGSSDSLAGYDIELYSMSEDYFKHYYTLQLYYQNQNDIGFEQPTQIFYNVKGGYGIFGSIAESSFFVPFPY